MKSTIRFLKGCQRYLGAPDCLQRTALTTEDQPLMRINCLTDSGLTIRRFQMIGEIIPDGLNIRGIMLSLIC